MTSTPRSLRKVAVLIASLEPAHAEALLGQMSSEQAVAVRRAVEQLGALDAGEQNEVIEEFFRIGPLLPDEDAAGIELDAPLPKSMARLSSSSPLAESAARASQPFRFLYDVTTAKLVELLKPEHPQTIALVISHLPADRAAELLAHLPAESQTAVARRLVDLAETDPEILREVERSLQSRLCAEVAGEQRRTAGVAALSGILGAAPPQARHNILSNLARHDRELAGKLDVPARPGRVFADLERMDLESLAVVLAHAEAEILSLALAGATPRLAHRAIAALPPDRASGLRAALCNLGPTRLSDVEEAQRLLAELAGQLELDGEITPAIRGHLSVAV